jgi:hypothetical protein
MPVPTSLIDRPGRAAVTAGVLLAASAAAAMALAVGTASAAAPGRCTTDVNVRTEPAVTAPVVGRCAEGTAVQVGEERDGFVQLAELGGWAAAQYVARDDVPVPAPAGDAPAPPAADAGPTAEGTTSATRPASQQVVVDGVDRTPADDQDATGIGATTTRTWVDADGATHTLTTTSTGG